MGKLFDNSLLFNNNWNDILDYNKSTNLKLSIVITSYHPRHLKEVLVHLSKLGGIYEVIVVFDGPNNFSNSILDDYNYNFTFIQHDKNYNTSSARNTGAVFANGDLILFLDHDMIISPNYIPLAKKLLAANDNKAIILGFRDTVDFENVPSFENWKESNFENDWRMNTTIEETFLDLTVSNCGSSINNCDKNSVLKIYEISDGFRNLGTSIEKTIGYWDLPSMVISHTLTIPKKEFFLIGGYPEWIKGWGGEDIALGFLATAAHLPIIPACAGGYHIKHPPYSGSEEKKWQEMKLNLQKYKKWSSTINEFPIVDVEKCHSRSKVLYKSR